MAKLVIFGAGDIARIAHYCFTHDSEHEVVAFTVDREYRAVDSLLDLPLVDFQTVQEKYPPASHQMFIAVGYAKMNTVRASKYYQARDKGYCLASYASSRCTFLSGLPVGDNCLILEDVTVQPFVKIGNDVTIWSGSCLAHDTVIGDHCFIAPCAAISGRVRIGEYCFVGINATLRNAITIAPRTLIGAGAVILDNTVEAGVYMARPGVLRNTKKRSDGDVAPSP
jgi:sugar O-acyltransferase (sialic acid O-acetyltransferase NeuD family)